MTAVLDQVRGIVSMIFNVPLEDVTAETSTETLENWDSMGHLMLILELEQQFEREFSPEEVEQMHDVATIARIVASSA
jgi:acyl carrier protein